VPISIPITSKIKIAFIDEKMLSRKPDYNSSQLIPVLLAIKVAKTAEMTRAM
jgi:hypothetical protein